MALAEKTGVGIGFGFSWQLAPGDCVRFKPAIRSHKVAKPRRHHAATGFTCFPTWSVEIDCLLVATS
jgi:hypothetical protein